MDSAPADCEEPRERELIGLSNARLKAYVNINIIKIQRPSGIIATNTLTPEVTQKALNSIWDTQAQIKFSKKTSRVYEYELANWVQAEISDGVIDADKGGKIDADFRTELAEQNIGQAGIDIFFVRSLKGYTTDGTVGAAPDGGRHWFMQSDGNGSNAGQILGHEAGHCMSLGYVEDEYNENDTKNLMYSKGGNLNGRQLYPKQADKANKFVRDNQSTYKQ